MSVGVDTIYIIIWRFLRTERRDTEGTRGRNIEARSINWDLVCLLHSFYLIVHNLNPLLNRLLMCSSLLSICLFQNPPPLPNSLGKSSSQRGLLGLELLHWQGRWHRWVGEPENCSSKIFAGIDDQYNTQKYVGKLDEEPQVDQSSEVESISW